VGVDDLHASGARLLIAVDCGSKDHLAVERASRLGMDVVVLDHHRITEPPPDAAIVASAQLIADSPYAALSAAGVTYLLATALAEAGFDTGAGSGNEPTVLLDLAMIGIVGDVSPLLGINRPLVRDGLRTLRGTRRPGLQALADEGRFDLRAVTSGDIAFKVSPRLNAPGRLADPRPAFELLTSTRQAEARRLAKLAEDANRERKRQQERILEAVEATLLDDPARLDRRVLIFAGDAWAPGIIGLAAGKLVDRFARPVIVLSRAGEVAHGSARSVPGFDIADALTSVSSLLRRHGGHARAAGLTLDASRIAELEEALEAAIAVSPAEPPGPPRLEIDADASPDQLTLEVARRLQSLGPFGEGNPPPLLRIQGAPLREYQVIGKERTHLKIRLRNGVEALFWSNAGRSRELVGAREVDLVGTLETSIWNDIERAQLIVRDFRAPTA
jgi:single-stranded-DNA-specific exonuclease